MSTGNTSKIKVLGVDDSALVRSLMTEIINSQPDMHVCATAPDPLVARELIKLHNPDGLMLDIEMPRMKQVTHAGRPPPRLRRRRKPRTSPRRI